MSLKKVIALNTIHITVTPGEHGDKATGKAPKKPETMEIKPGTNFMVETEKKDGQKKSQYDELNDAKAIRDWSSEDERALRNMQHVVGEYDPEQSGSSDDDAKKIAGASATNDAVIDDGKSSLAGVKTTEPGMTTTAAVSSTDSGKAGKSAVASAV